MRHAIWADTPPCRIVTACCGVTVRQADVVATPTCPVCRERLEQYEEMEF